MKKKLATGLTMLMTAVSSVAVFGQAQRPPAVPLIANDPYFSVWSMADTLNSQPTKHWTGKQQDLTSLVRIDGKAFTLMGAASDALPAAKQVSLTVLPTRSIYVFEEAGVQITLTFMTPLLPDDLVVMSRPITYVTWSAKSTSDTAHDVAVYLDADALLAVNKPDQVVTTAAGTAGGLTTLKVGTVEQPVLEARGDDQRIDWGYFYIASTSKAATIVPADAGRGAFAKNQMLQPMHTANPSPASDAEVLATTFDLGKVAATPVAAHAILAYDDNPGSIRYFNSDIKGYWTKDGATFADLLQTAEKEYASLNERCEKFDTELVADLKKLGGESYVQIGVLAYRQSLAAQKICADANGQPLSFSKENFSNGCCATVDVLYPASPLMMAFSPNLLKASLRPLMDYSSSPRWKHDSAPHDLGTYPHATGQVYGGGDSDSGMPVEETGNMLCMMAALAKIEGNADFSKPYWPTLTKWANYLKANGFDPGNQLTTDDFAGHIARNTNLSAKAIMGVASYAYLADLLGKPEVAKEYTATAKAAALEWMKKSDQGDHYGLVFGDKGKGTWSQKYNLVWDKIFGWNIFPQEVYDKEWAFYNTKFNNFGLPLDSRRTYTKADWEMWTATLSDKKEDFQKMSDALARWTNETPVRVPFGDWHETVTPKKEGFQARSVIGGVFIPILRDPEMWKKYASRDTAKLDNWAVTDFRGPATKVIVAAADTAAATWQYTFEKPGDDWFQPSFDAKGWKTGKSGFGTRGTPAARVGTEWNGEDVWLRRDVTLPAEKLSDPRLWMHHDEEAEVYINGVLAARPKGFTAEYVTVKINKNGLAALKPGKNSIAVHCHQTIAGQYVDVGIVDLVPVSAKK
ncbi:MAG: Glutaminase [Phycisphaerales bacterium]|nr:Glutaminase [Phycisphaerales bacterium]